LLSLGKKHIEDNQTGAANYCHIGDVEGWIMPATELDINEIHDEAEPYSVGNVSGNAAKQQHQRAENTVIRARRSPKEVDYQSCRNDADYERPQRPASP